MFNDDVEISLGHQSFEGLMLRGFDPVSPTSKVKQERRRIQRRISSISIGTFYSTPIVKYWLSLVFRLTHIILFAYTVSSRILQKYFHRYHQNPRLFY